MAEKADSDEFCFYDEKGNKYRLSECVNNVDAYLTVGDVIGYSDYNASWTFVAARLDSRQDSRQSRSEARGGTRTPQSLRRTPTLQASRRG